MNDAASTVAALWRFVHSHSRTSRRLLLSDADRLYGTSNYGCWRVDVEEDAVREDQWFWRMCVIEEMFSKVRTARGIQLKFAVGDSSEYPTVGVEGVSGKDAGACSW